MVIELIGAQVYDHFLGSEDWNKMRLEADWLETWDSETRVTTRGIELDQYRNDQLSTTDTVIQLYLKAGVTFHMVH